MIRVSMVPKDLLHTCWGQIEGYLAKAAEYTYGRYTVDDIKDCITDYDHDLWVAYRVTESGPIFYGAVVTEIAQYPRKKMLAMHFIGGIDGYRWKSPMLGTLRLWAKDNNCDGIESIGRLGWAKIFKDDGYTQLGAMYELPIEGDVNGNG